MGLKHWNEVYRKTNNVTAVIRGKNRYVICEQFQRKCRPSYHCGTVFGGI